MANNLAIDIFNANETMAMLNESVKSSDIILNGGNDGLGIPSGIVPTILTWNFLLKSKMYENNVPKTTFY